MLWCLIPQRLPPDHGDQLPRPPGLTLAELRTESLLLAQESEVPVSNLKPSMCHGAHPTLDLEGGEPFPTRHEYQSGLCPFE